LVSSLFEQFMINKINAKILRVFMMGII